VARIAQLAALPVRCTHAADLAAVVAFVRQVQAVDVAGVAPARAAFDARLVLDAAWAERDEGDEGDDAGAVPVEPGRSSNSRSSALAGQGEATHAAALDHLPTAALLANTKSRQGPFFAVRSPRAQRAPSSSRPDADTARNPP
jgi:Asp-tRNA(Asn)/Glu-tRNA(Gln) amidotransferase C subunit